MISVMNNADFEVDRKGDAVGDQPRSNPRVSVDDEAVVVDDSDKVTSSGGGSIGSNGTRVLHGGDVGRADEFGPGENGGDGLSLDSIGGVEVGGSMGFQNRALDSENVYANVGQSSEPHKSRLSEMGERRNKETNERSVCSIENEGWILMAEKECWDVNSGDKSLEFKEKDKVSHGEKRPASATRMGDDLAGDLGDIHNNKAKEHLHVANHGLSQYDSLLSMFDEFEATRRSGELTKHVGYGYEVGDMVWGKVKSHPWWPGHIFSEALASPSVRRTKREGHVLVAFFGDSSYGWFDPAELIPFDINFAEKSQQTNSRTFLKAVEEAVDEASRRCSLGLACRCRVPNNFRPVNVEGYFSVDFSECEPGGVYSAGQIKRSRDTFQARETIAFIRHLAMAPSSTEHESFDFIKNKATALAYRRAVYEEFDETYAQAFGHQPVRPSRESIGAAAQAVKAPLSGPLVIAEALGKQKSSIKQNKMIDQSKKDRYLFKRRDEPNELKIQRKNQGQAGFVTQPIYVAGSAAAGGGYGGGDYVLQKRPSMVSAKPEVQTGDVTGKVAAAAGSQPIEAKLESPISVPLSQAPDNISHVLENKPSFDDTGKNNLHVTEGGSRSDVPVAAAMDGLVSSAKTIFPAATDTSESNVTEVLQQHSWQPVRVEKLDDDSNNSSNIFVSNDEKPIDGSSGKKVKVRKRPVGELMTVDSAQVERKKKKKKGVGAEMSSDRSQMRAVIPSHGLALPRDDSKLDHQRKTDVATSSLSPDSVGMESGFPQLLHDLQAIALDPFHGVEKKSPALVKQVFLRFRSLVYQKSLFSSPPADDSKETPAGKSSDNPPTLASVRDLSVQKLEPLVRPDDPTKGGRKRGPSDRQEEMAVKKAKKIKDVKVLAAERKAAQKTAEAPPPKEGTPPKQAKTAAAANKQEQPMKKIDRPPRIPEPTMLVMKFPPGGGLPSLSELKMRFARFGPLDHSATRVFWKSSTCRLVYRYKPDAQAAHRFVSGSTNLFGYTSVRCFLRDMGDSAPESESGTGMEQRQVPALAPLYQQQPVQLKSCLKKSSGDEPGPASGGNGSGRGGGSGARVKFVLGEEENGSTTNKNNGSFAGGGGSTSSSTSTTSTSTTLGMEINSKNFQKLVSPPSVFHTTTAQTHNAPNNVMNYGEAGVVPRNVHNFNVQPNISSTASNVDITQQMLSLMTECNEIVNNVAGLLGYMPYHPI